MLLEQQNLFEELQKTEEGKQRMVRDQLAPLLSDMEAFKSANPSSTFVDFISWHSPKDLINGNQLSGRFLGDTTWKQLWETAKEFPV